MNFEEAVVSSDCLDPGFRGRACNDLDASTRAQGSQEPSRSGIYGAATRHVGQLSPLNRPMPFELWRPVKPMRNR